MFPYFRNGLMKFRNISNYSPFIINSRIHISRNLCLCGRRDQNFSEKQTRFNGIHITINKGSYPSNGEGFEIDLQGLFKQWRCDGRRSVFLQVPICQSHLITIASKYGFEYHHARNDHAVLSLWLVKDTKSKLPDFANHTLGVAGACFNQETNDVLLVQDKGRYAKWWKFPGGFSEKGEFIGDAAVRETFEETGIQARFESVLSLREQHGTLFDQSDFYFICRLHPLTSKIYPCPDEIENCKWMNIHDVLAMTDCTPFVKLVCKLLLIGVQKGFHEVDLSSEEMDSWVIPNRKYRLYHRPLTLGMD